MRSKEIIELDYKNAKKYFMEVQSYVNFDLPYYFDFTTLLEKVDNLVNGKKLSKLCRKIEKEIKGEKKKRADSPKFYENVNYEFLSNKDGAYAWRPFQLIHPILYVDLVNVITNKVDWEIIRDRFNEFKKSSVECISIPRISQDKNSHKSSQVKYWWEKIEQQSIEMALDYDYIFITDISNCYGSIYTHSLEWALHQNGREGAKKDFNSTQNIRTIGSNIDNRLRSMNYGQTNGIPQGSNLMDFIAEIVLGYADLELTKAMLESRIHKKDFRILRYRDDYRIFVNNPVLGKDILKLLTDVLYKLGLKMNESKTVEGDDIITSSIKKDKLERFYTAPKAQSYQKEALRIYHFAKKYSNSGSLVRDLSDYYDRIENFNTLKATNIDVLISIFVSIIYRNPKTTYWGIAIISLLLRMIDSKGRREKIIQRIHNKFKKLPNSSLIDVWLQRLSATNNITIEYEDILTECAIEKADNLKLWESDWLDGKIAKEIASIKISNLNEEIKTKRISPSIARFEVELFKLDYDD